MGAWVYLCVRPKSAGKYFQGVSKQANDASPTLLLVVQPQCIPMCLNPSNCVHVFYNEDSPASIHHDR